MIENNLKVSIIIAVYKDIEALNLIIKSLEYQTYKNFEVIIAEDGESSEMAEYVSKITNLKVIHTTQEDLGVRKSHSQNNAIRNSSGEYLIFIDGDCILYSNFIENHIRLSGKNNIISGRRVNLGPKYSTMLRSAKINSFWLEKNFLKKYFSIAKDAKQEKHTEEGILIKPFGFIHNKLLKNKKKHFPLLGCNFSCYRKALLDINGFDEELGNAAVAGDTDLEWRFQGLGYKIIVGRFIVNQFHLYHKRKVEDYSRGIDEQMINNKKEKVYRCIKGINS